MAGEFVLSGGGDVTLSRECVEKLLGAASGDAALLYIYILSRGGRFDCADASGAIHRSEGQVEGAMDVLTRLGLVTRTARPGPARLDPPDELPQYSDEEIAREQENGSVFASLLEEVQKAMGATLSSEGVRTLFGIYNELGLDADIILLMVNYCVSEHQKRYGPGRRPSMRAIEKTAYVWSREGLFSHEAAVDYIKRQEDLRREEKEMAAALGLHGRTLSPTERRYIDSWIGMGFGPEAAAIGYDRTVVNTGSLTWRYMDSILKSWHSRGLHAPKDIEEKDPPGHSRRAARKTNGAGQSSSGSKLSARELDELEATLRLMEGDSKK